MRAVQLTHHVALEVLHESTDAGFLFELVLPQLQPRIGTGLAKVTASTTSCVPS